MLNGLYNPSSSEKVITINGINDLTIRLFHCLINRVISIMILIKIQKNNPTITMKYIIFQKPPGYLSQIGLSLIIKMKRMEIIMDILIFFIIDVGVFFTMPHNGGHMRSGGFRSESLSTEGEATLEALRLATHKPRHYLYAVLPPVVLLFFIHLTISSYL